MEQGTSISTRELAMTCDWAKTDLGPRDQWPESVRQVVAALFESPLPVAYQHGERFAMVYNDAFAQLLGAKHPAAWGRPAPEVVAEVWDQPTVAPAFNEVLRSGTPFLDEGTELRLARGRGSGGLDVGYYLRAGSPVRDADGKVIGVLHLVIETTQSVQRVQAIANLASELAVAVTVDDVCKVALRHALSTLPVAEVMVCLAGRGPGSRWFVTTRRRDESTLTDDERLPLIWADLEGDSLRDVEQAVATGEVYAGEPGGVVAFPMRMAGRAGALALRLRDSSAGSRLGAETIALVATGTELVGEALARAQLYDHERTTAEAVQRTLLPQTLPQTGSVMVAARYEPALIGSVAGGDFYDAFVLPDGRLALVVGDVVGRGMHAATVMGQIRSAARGAALTWPEPASVMTALDHLVHGLDALRPASFTIGGAPDRRPPGDRGELFVTLLYGVLDPASGELTLASAGHYPPAVIRSGNADREEDGRPAPLAELVSLDTGPPLGIAGERPVHTVQLAVGDVLLGFTDGLLERRSRSLVDGEEALLEVLDGLVGESPRSVCQHVIEGMVSAEGFEDDCALLAVARTPVGHRRSTLVVPPVPEAVKPARDWARRQMAEWGIDAEHEFTVITGLSELVTNTVLHAGTDAHVTLDVDDSRITVTVSDSGSRGVPRMADIDPVSGRGRGLGLVKSISDAFGTHRSATGSTVWFEIALTPAEDYARA